MPFRKHLKDFSQGFPAFFCGGPFREESGDRGVVGVDPGRLVDTRKQLLELAEIIPLPRFRGTGTPPPRRRGNIHRLHLPGLEEQGAWREDEC